MPSENGLGNTNLYPTRSYQTDAGRLSLHLQIWDTGNGLHALLTGGDKPHIGGVVLAVPRRSLSGEGWSSDLYITPVPQHKDVELASPLADLLARLCHTPVVVTAGIHSDSLTPEELKILKENYSDLLQHVQNDILKI